MRVAPRFCYRALISIQSGRLNSSWNFINLSFGPFLKVSPFPALCPSPTSHQSKHQLYHNKSSIHRCIVFTLSIRSHMDAAVTASPRSAAAPVIAGAAAGQASQFAAAADAGRPDETTGNTAADDPASADIGGGGDKGGSDRGMAAGKEGAARGAGGRPRGPTSSDCIASKGDMFGELGMARA